MISKKEYELGLNPDRVEWNKMNSDTQAIIVQAKIQQIYNTFAEEWVETTVDAGVRCANAYRIHPDTPYKKDPITKAVYDVALNPDGVAWGKLGEKDLVKIAIKEASSRQYLSCDGIWQNCSSKQQYQAGMVYRIHPNTPWYDLNVVEATAIKGLSLHYGDSVKGDFLRFKRGKDVADVGIHDIIDGLRGKLDWPLLGTIAGWHDINRPDGVL